MTERLHFHVSLSCIGEGNGNPLQCSCLENPRDGGAWWVAVYGVAHSRTRLKRLSSSSIEVKIFLRRCDFFINFILFLNLKHCISFAKHQNESATGIQGVINTLMLFLSDNS